MALSSLSEFLVKDYNRTEAGLSRECICPSLSFSCREWCCCLINLPCINYESPIIGPWYWWRSVMTPITLNLNSRNDFSLWKKSNFWFGSLIAVFTLIIKTRWWTFKFVCQQLKGVCQGEVKNAWKICCKVQNSKLGWVHATPWIASIKYSISTLGGVSLIFRVKRISWWNRFK